MAMKYPYILLASNIIKNRVIMLIKKCDIVRAGVRSEYTSYLILAF